ncbi:MAG TPA: hypothetical protein GXX53_04250 [Tissierellia bacterium]|nr:hypothetical protein [Tissierellia bacterium]
MRLSKGEKIVYALLILSLIMINPPILNLINNYAKQNPLTGNFPTLWLWLQIWYVVAMASFLIGAAKIKNWKKDYRR